MKKSGINIYCNWDKLPNEISSKIKNSWQRIFDLNTNSYLAPCTEIQATFWELRLDQVRDVKEFTGR